MRLQEKCACGAMVQVDDEMELRRDAAIDFVKEWRRGHKKCLERVEWRPSLPVPAARPNVVALPEKGGA